jgi:hypothetical protein
MMGAPIASDYHPLFWLSSTIQRSTLVVPFIHFSNQEVTFYPSTAELAAELGDVGWANAPQFVLLYTNKIIPVCVC